MYYPVCLFKSWLFIDYTFCDGLIINLYVYVLLYLFLDCMLFFFFKQKTAYEMRISDWSSDVCSSDLLLFRLTTECIRVRSNETRAHESLSSLTLHVVGTDRDMAGHDADILRQHLQLVPASGDIALLLALPQTCIDRLGGVRTSLEKRVGYRLDRKSTRLNSSH